MIYNWSPLSAELAQWRAEKLNLPIWWRDDDAVARGPALGQLSNLSAALELPVHLAVIPKFVTSGLVEVCADGAGFVPLVHGWAHESRTVGTEKKAEFGTFRGEALEELAAALSRMDEMFGGRLLKVFVPPWNRISPELVLELSGLGYAALSTFAPRAGRLAAPEMVQINTHIDPIFWRGGGGLVEPDALIHRIVNLLKDRRLGHTDAAEPLGFLTHHLVHDEDIWDFTQACLRKLLDGGAKPINLLDLKDNLP
jgi:hypothetical protein